MQLHFDAKNIIYASICAVFGLLSLIKPDLMWKLEHLLTVRDGEPPERYKTYVRVGGVILLIAAVALLFVNFNRGASPA